MAKKVPFSWKTNIPAPWLAAVFIFGGYSAPCVAQGQTDQPKWTYAVGLRTWIARWDSWTVGQTATGVAVGNERFEVVASARGSTEVSAIPVLSARFGPTFVAVSAMATTKYGLKDTATPGGFEVNSSRREADVNLGYTFGAGVTSSLGYKQIRQRFGAKEYDWKGPVLGIGVSLPVVETWGAYTSLGLGRFRGSFPTSAVDANGRTHFNADYTLVDVGMTRSFGQLLPAVNSAVLTLGYRVQRMATKGYMLGRTPENGSRAPNTTSDLIDITGGFVVGFQASF